MLAGDEACEHGRRRVTRTGQLHLTGQRVDHAEEHGDEQLAPESHAGPGPLVAQRHGDGPQRVEVVDDAVEGGQHGRAVGVAQGGTARGRPHLAHHGGCHDAPADHVADEEGDPAVGEEEEEALGGRLEPLAEILERFGQAGPIAERGRLRAGEVEGLALLPGEVAEDLVGGPVAASPVQDRRAAVGVRWDADATATVDGRART